MRNVYICIIAVLLSFNSNAQNLQNANWYFGNQGGLTFLSGGPVPLSSSVMNVQEGTATVSDQLGNLLFYTNGVKVWNKNHIQMTNGTGLYGHDSSCQGVIIVPKPANPDKYYIVTIDGGTGIKKGLHYSEVDMTLLSGLGDVIVGTKNTPLKDHLGVNISTAYGNNSEKLTSAKHSNGVDYWVVTQIKNYIYTYLVTATNISFYSSTLAPVNIPNGTNYDAGTGQMKVSPDNQRIGICYGQYNSPSTTLGAVALGNFDNSTGVVTMDPGIITVSGEGVFYGLEFSPDSQVVYFSNPHNIFYTSSSTSAVQSYYVTNYYQGSLQRAIDNKIYYSPISNYSQISVIDNPNNLSSPNIQIDAVTIYGIPRLGLPQWVHWHNEGEDDCTPLVLTSEPNTNFIYDNKSTITAQTAYTIATGKDISMKADQYIVLKPDSHIIAGSKYWGKIESCEGIIEPRPGPGDNGKVNQEMQELSLIDTKLFILSPNPASETVTISASESIQSIVVASFDGKVIFMKDFRDGVNKHELYVGNYVKGFYSVTVTTKDGKVETNKLIKD